MIPRPISEITEDDLAALVTNQVAEGRTIEYKRTLPGGADGEKKEFLADVSSFANSGGGDLVFGVEESGGLPIAIPGFQVGDLDLEIRRLDSILGAGLSPRIRYALRTVPIATGSTVLVLRVERSWSGPHRVIFGGHDKFYGRTSAGKYALDVNELRSAFVLSNTVTERIRSFRADRVISLGRNETPLPFVDAPKIVLHCMPFESFASEVRYDVLPFYDNPALFPPMGTRAWDRRLNLEGVLIYGTETPCATYTQLYRTSVIEMVNGRILAALHEGTWVIPSVAYERYIVQYLPTCFRALTQLGSGAPVAVAITLLRTRGLSMLTEQFGWPEVSHPITSEMIMLPEVIVEDLTIAPGKILKPLFDLVWNACGLRGSQNFDPNGNWVGR